MEQNGACLALWEPKEVRRHLEKARHGKSARKDRNDSRLKLLRLRDEVARQRGVRAGLLGQPAATSAESRLAPNLDPSVRSPREAWIKWLAPHFAPSGGGTAAYLTGTYSDEYGFPNGLTLPRNVHKDLRRFLDEVSLAESDFICGVEPHRYRDVLHLHAIISGSFTPDQLQHLKLWWSAQRGHSRVLPVLDGCASYVTKYALKGDCESFDWRLS